MRLSKRTRRLLPVVLLLGLVLRLIRLNGRPLWYDEAYSILYAQTSFNTLWSGLTVDVHPLLYYSGLHVWIALVGQELWAVRALSVLLGTATIGMVYLLARRLFGAHAGLVAALITALSPFHVYYSQETRMYALLGFGAISATYFLVRAWTDGGRFNWTAYAITAALMLYAHNLGALFLAGLGLWVLWAWYRGPRWRHVRALLFSHLLVLLLFAPWLTILPSQLGKVGRFFWVTVPGLTELLQTILIFHFAYDNQALPPWLLAPALLFSAFVLAFLVLEGRRLGAEASERERFPYPYALLVLTTAGPILLAFLISQVQPIYTVRALLPSALVYYVLVGRVVFSGRTPPPLKWGLAAGSLLLVGASLANHYAYERFPRAPYREVVQSLHMATGPDTVIVHSNKLTLFPTHYHDRRLPQAYVADPPGSPSDNLSLPTQQALGLLASPDLEAATAGADTVYFLIFEQAVAEFAESAEGHPQLAWLDRHYRLEEQRRYADLLLYRYQKQ